MYQKSVLGVDQCQAAIKAMLEEASKYPETPLAMAIVDDGGNLISFARMDGAPPRSQGNSIKKAYTAAIVRTDTGAYAQQIRDQGIAVGDFGDPNLIPLQGGIVVKMSDSGQVLGGIGVSGFLSGAMDEEVAHKGMKALGL